jgi:hypothetical protein
MGHTAALFARQLKPVQRSARQLRGKSLKELHAARRAGKASWLIQAFSVLPTAIVRGDRIHK